MEQARRAFDKLKKKFKKKPILITFDSTKLFEIFTNTSNTATGAVLTQKDENRTTKPCFFYSKPLFSVE